MGFVQWSMEIKSETQHNCIKKLMIEVKSLFLNMFSWVNIHKMLITFHVQMCTSIDYATTFIWNPTKPCTLLISFAYLAFYFVWTCTCRFSLKFFKQTKYHTKKISEIEKEYPKFVTCFAHPIDFPLEM